MPFSREYQAPSIQQSGCSYSGLRKTYAPKAGTEPAVYDVPKFLPSGPGPKYPPGPDALTHGVSGGCGGYFSLSSAYPFATCDSCNVERTTRKCDGYISESYKHRR